MSRSRIWLDRRLPHEFVRELEPGGALRWVADFAVSKDRTPLTDLVLAGESKKGRRSKVHVYGGTAGLLTVVWHGRGRVELQARDTETFRALAFPSTCVGPRQAEEFMPLVPAVCDYIAKKAAIAATGRYGKEGRVQVAIMRGGDAWTSLDREVIPEYLDLPSRLAVQESFHRPIDNAREHLASTHRWAAG